MTLTLLLALALSNHVPPCPAGKAECKPWERQWAEPKVNPFDKYDPKPPKPRKLGTGPHTLIIGSGPNAVQREYKSGSACERARDDVLSQVGSRQMPGGGYFYSSVAVFCVPR